MSQANYIIICQGRIRVKSTKDSRERVVHASDAATELVKHIDTMHPTELTDADTQPITSLQHEMMDNLDTATKEEMEQSVVQMFVLLDALEHKFEHHEY